MEDDVTYSLPSQPLGELAHPLVRSQLERIFSYRQETILKILQGAPV
jgi:ligand-binding SRPBCC domain-containing protein